MKRFALITGASSKIGMSIAKKLGEDGYSLILHYYKNTDSINKFKQKYPNFEVYDISADLSTKDGVDQFLSEIDQNNLHPDIIIHVAGIPNYGLIQDVSFEDWQQVMNIMVMSDFFIVQHFVPHMIRSHYGRIINISSVWGQIGAANEVLYSTAKGAIDTFTKALAKELAPSGITVNAIAPGVVITPMMSDFTCEDVEALKNEIPANRFAEPEEIAYHVLHLVQPESSYMTGQIIRIDGGWF